MKKMINKIYDSPDDALLDIAKDHMTILCGGFGLCGMPESLVYALGRTGVTGLTVASNNAGIDGVGLGKLLESRQIDKMISSYVGNNKIFAQQYINGDIEIEFNPQGTFAERIRAGGAGIPAFFTKTGVGTQVAEGKEHRDFAGETYILEHGLVADIALIRAEKADAAGNLVFNKTAMNFNPEMATAAKITLVEVDQIVGVGELDPNHIHVPSIYVQRIVKSTIPKKIEFVTNRERNT